MAAYTALARWLFDEGSGTSVGDDTGNSNALTITDAGSSTDWDANITGSLNIVDETGLPDILKTNIVGSGGIGDALNGEKEVVIIMAFDDLTPTLYNAGDYDSEHVPQMLKYAKNNLHRVTDGVRAFGHWHYTYLYYSQVVYRQGRNEWEPFRDKLYKKIVKEQSNEGSWTGSISPVYVTSCNLVMLQLDKGLLPIFQR